jgi:alcohol dehydrogenase class IV
VTALRFVVSTEVVSGLGSAGSVGAAVDRLGGRRVAVIADAGVAAAGVLDTVLGQAGVEPVWTGLVDPDPGIAVVEANAGGAREQGADLVLAVGGGSALGVGKAVGIRLTNDGPIDAYEGNGLVTVTPTPTIAVPTTAGSGSEVSNALVLHEPGRSKELVVRGPGCEPRVAVLDGRLLRGLPRDPMLHAGLDALSHAVEALWARGATFFTDGLALHAARAILRLLPRALDGIPGGDNAGGHNDQVLQELLEASSAANMACGNSGLALIHALSTSPAVRIPHGLQNAVLLPHVGRFNQGHMSAEGAALLPLIDRLYDEIGFSPSFDDLTGAGAASAEHMLAASAGHPFRVNNRRASTDAELSAVLESAGAG